LGFSDALKPNPHQYQRRRTSFTEEVPLLELAMKDMEDTLSGVAVAVQ
jgi:hypothetical protein